MKPGDTVYLIENNLHVRQATIVKINGNFAIIKFHYGSGTQIHINRLFATESEALDKLGKTPNTPDKPYKELGKWNAQLL